VQKVIDGVGAPVNYLFALTREGIYYWDAPARNLLFFNFASWKSRIVVTPQMPGQGVGVSPDGHWLIYTQFDTAPGSDLMLVENFH
jgi:hypothetical protein